MADIKNFGLRGVGSDLQLGKGGGRFIYDDVNGRFDFVLADGVTLEDVRADNASFAGNITFTGDLTDNNAVAIDFFVTEAMGIVNNDNDVTLPTSAAVIDYVDTAVADFQGNITIGDGSVTDVVDFQSNVLLFTGGTNLTSAVTNDEVTFNLDDNINLTSVTATGTVQGGSITDGTATITGGAITGTTDITASGTVTGGTLTDGTATITGGDITTTGTVDAGTVEFDNLSGAGAVSITDFVTTVTPSDTVAPTANAVVEYVAGEIANLSSTLTMTDGNGGNDVFDLLTGNLTFAGGTNITSAVTNDTVTFNLDDNITLAGNVTAVGGDFTTVNATNVNSPNIDAGTVEFDSLSGTGAVSVTDIIDDDTMATASATTLATSESVKAYVDSEITSLTTAGLDIAGDTGTDTVALGEQISFVGTINEVETVVTDNQVQIGLPDDVTIGGNLQVTGNFFSDDITASTVTVDGDAVITGNLTVAGTQTIVNSTEVEIADAVIRVNSDGNVVSAGLEANVDGTIESILFNPNEVINPDTNQVGGWVFSDDLVVNTTAVLNDLVFTNLRASDNSDPNVISGFISAAETFSATDEKLPTANAVIEYVAGEISALSSTLTMTDGNGGNDVFDLLTGNLTFAGGTNITSAVTDDTVTFDLDSSVTLAGTDAQLTINNTESGAPFFAGSATLTLQNVEGSSTISQTFGPNGGLTMQNDANDGISVTGQGINLYTAGSSVLPDLQVTAAGDVQIANNLNVDGAIEFDSLSGTGAVAITDFETTIQDSDTVAPTSGAVVDYVAQEVATFSNVLNITDGVTSDAVDLLNDTLTFTGNASSVTAVVSDNEVTFGLTDTVDIVADLNVGGNITTGGGSGGSITGADLISTVNLTVTGNVDFGGSILTGVIDDDTFATASDTTVATSESIKAYVDSQVGTQDLDFAGDSGTGAVDLDTQSLTVSGTANQIQTSASGQTVTVGLTDDVTLVGSLTAVDATLSGNVQFGGSLTDGTTAISGFVTAADTIGSNDNDATVPTTAAVIDYVANNSGDGLLLRAAYTAAGASQFTVGTVPSIAGRTYYGARVKLKVSTAFSGGSFDHVLVKENGGAGATIVAEADADAAVADTYVIEIDDVVLTAGADVIVEFKQADGTTASVPTAGSMTASVEYNWV